MALTVSCCSKILQILVAFMLAAEYFVDGPGYVCVRALQTDSKNVVPIVKIPPVLQNCRTTLDSVATAEVVSKLKSGAGFVNVSAFCENAGLLCNQTVVSLAGSLFALGGYTAETETADIDLSVFFGDRKLALGNRVPLSAPKPLPTRAFLPRALEEELPFSSETLPQLLSYFHFSNSSHMARSMAKTLKVCEALPMKSETKKCVASFESMKEFAETVIGTRDLEILVGADTNDLQPEELLTVKSVKEIKSAGRAVACHNAMFPYEVFYCHQLWGTKTLKVELQTDKSEQLYLHVASCHEEANLLSKRVFDKLQLQAGELVCHWNFGDSLVWIPAAP